jgi:tRNA(Ile)-lysidine synthase
MASLVDSILEFCTSHGADHRTGKKYWIAYSGGLDSHVLLHLFSQIRQKISIHLQAIYVHHGLSPNADAWAGHCKKVCDDLKIDFCVKKISVTISENKEESARQHRYQIFSELMSEKDLLLTAHHQDDQAETILLQLTRGAGPKGLSAMPALKKFSKGLHARPLLNFTRDELKKYALENHLQWIEDESNENVNFSRNFMRHEVMPILKKKWPSMTATMARSAEHFAEMQEYLDQIITKKLQDSRGKNPLSLSIQKLLTLDDMEQRHVLRAWLAELNYPVPPAVKLKQIQKDMLHAREDKAPFFFWKNIELRRYRDEIFLLTVLPEHDAAQRIAWNLSTSLKLAHGNLLTKKVIGDGMRADCENITVRFRQGGEVVRLPGRDFHHDLKKLFQEWGVLPWERDRIPLIYVGEKLAAVPGFLIADEFRAKKEQEGYLLSWRFPLARE